MKLIIIAALPCVVTWLATGMFSQSVAQNQSLIVAQSQSESPQYNSADYVGSEAARMLRSFSHTTHARLTTLGSWKGRVTGRRRLSRTRQDTPRRRRSEKDHLLQEQAGQGDFGDVLLATPAVKSTNEHLQIRSKSSNRSSTEIETRGEVYGPCGAILRWLIQRGIVVIPKSVRQERMAEIFDVFGFELEDEDMEVIHTLDTATSLFFDHRDPAMVKLLSEAKRNT
jgi:hypothetical protein